MLRALFDGDAGIPAEDVTILIATGTHRANTPAELEAMLGADIVAPLPGHQPRQPRRRRRSCRVGTTATGVPV